MEEELDYSETLMFPKQIKILEEDPNKDFKNVIREIREESFHMFSSVEKLVEEFAL